MKKTFLISILYLFILSCGDEITYESNTGNISGKVVLDSTALPHVTTPVRIQVRIIKTNESAITDSNGTYLFLGIPEGTYDLETYFNSSSFYGGIESVSVQPGKTTEAPDIVLKYLRSNPLMNFSSLYLTDASGEKYNLSQNPGYELIIDSRSVTLTAIFRIDNYPDYLLADTAVSIQLNDQLPHTVFSQKGWFSEPLSLLEGYNWINLWPGDEQRPDSKSGPFPVWSLESINTVNVNLGWDSYTAGGGDAGDFDLHMLYSEASDSCWYLNPEPDWGLTGIHFDNPSLSSNENFGGYSHGTENIDIRCAANGSYSLKVVYYSNHSDPQKMIRPTVELRLKEGSLITFTSPTHMSVGDVWNVAQFSFPGGNILKNGMVVKRELTGGNKGIWK